MRPLPARAAALMILAGSLAGCAGPTVLLSPRPESHRVDAPALRVAYADLADRLAAHASFYEHEVRRNHTKLRLMGVFAVLGAGGAAASTASAIHPQMPDATRPVVGAVGISLSVLSGVFVLLPQAHQYALKEAGYQRKAEESRSAFTALEARCRDGLTAVDDGACVEAAEEALAVARRFPLDSPCKPPPERDLDVMLRAAGSPR